MSDIDTLGKAVDIIDHLTPEDYITAVEMIESGDLLGVVDLLVPLRNVIDVVIEEIYEMEGLHP